MANIIKEKNNRYNNPMKNNNGFTLVEMIVTFLVLGILLAVSVMSLMAWQDWADFNRENEYAETLFLAAQNQLSEYSSNGTLSDFSDRAYKEAYGNKVNLDSIYYAEGENFTAELNKENSVWVSKTSGTLCYAACDKGDYKKYLAGEETESPTAPIVFELLEAYVYDTSILNETICIEFSLEDGQVFSAFYTDKSISKDDAEYAAFEYDNSNEALRGLVNIATRYESYRKDRMVGYYGVDTLSAALVAKNDKPTIARIALNNEETLNLSFKLGKYANATNELTYTISVYDNETKKKVLDIALDTASNHLKNYENRETVPCSVIRYNYNDAGGVESQELGNFDILAYLDKDNQVRVVLDAVDAKATTNLYNEDFDALFDTGGVVKHSDIKFANTLSFHRFGINAEKIYCSLQGYSSKYKATSVKQSNVSDVYFANETAGEEVIEDLGKVDHFNYTLKNARHLYNVRYIEDLSESNLKKYKKTEDGTAYFTYALIKDIDWKDFVDSESYYASNFSGVNFSKYYKTQNNINIMTDRSFASYGKLRMYDKFIGNDFTISGLDINEKFNVTSGLYGYDENTINTIEKPVGLFSKNYGLIKTTNLDNIQVTSSSDKVGAFCGVNVAGVLANNDKTGVLTELTVLNSGINTKDASVILGKKHVGGIVGYLQGVSEEEASNSNFDDVILSKLTNNAKVTGDKYVGGIIGEVRTSKTKAVKIIVDNCVNKGAVLASNSEVNADGVITVKSNTDPTKAKYIGGITGYTANVYANNHDEENVQELIIISNCVSTPVYSDSDLNALLDDSIDNAANVLSSKLNGVYVGGIVGYNYYSTIQSCTTKADKGKQGYVFGYQYVGGIVGFNQGPTSGIKGGDNEVSGVNAANVVGSEYVGGITGCNADVDSDKLTDEAITKGYNTSGKYTNEILEDSDIIVIPDIERNIENKIENWVNKGVIFATGKYAGGISGYNCGWIYNCNSEVESTNVDGFFQSTYSSGDYTGGIAGYNNGVIGNTKRELDADDNFVVSAGNKSEDARKISAVCYISGKNYVGGIVGYNDVDAIVEDYELAGGYILGDEEDSSYVGGYAGFNSSIRLFVDDDGNARAVISKPNRVIGEYFVGGSVGGNIINSDSAGRIPTIFKTDNFLGTLYGKAFVGGFVGYNMVTNTPDIYYEGETRSDVSNVIQQEIVSAFDVSDIEDKTDNQKLMDKVGILNGIYGNSSLKIKTSDAIMYISGSNEQMTQNSLGRIEADIYVGGVFGYNDDNTKVYVKDVENTTPIIADDAIEYNEQNGRNKDYAGRDFVYDYSYAGGIVGKVSRNMTVDNCSNSSSGIVTTMGTYTGGLTEVNEGLITSCKTSSFGKSSDDYIGGICGLNKKDGKVEKCTLKNITISGRDVVGGIAAENFGYISIDDVSGLKLLVSGKSVIDPDTNETATDGMAGGLAAYNAGKINVNNDINVNITSSGNYSGAVTALNDGNGIVINDKLTDNPDLSKETSEYSDKYVSISGNINGNKYVGGVIGKNISDNTDNVVAGFINKSVVNATRGTAGGIIGDNASGNIIAFCDNYEVVTAANAGNAGGITSVNSSTITKCNNYAEVKATSGMCGGIAAINNEDAMISYCLVEPKEGKTKLDFTSNESVGGISALNSGNIENIKLKNVNVYNYTTSDVSYIGVVTGINEKTGIVKLSKSDSSDKVIDNCTAKTYTDYSFVGGVAGTNKGAISGADLNSDNLPTTIIESFVGFMPNSAAIASLGGVAGANYGTINNISVDGQVIGDLGSEIMGYGGIAGTNGYITAKEASDALEEVKAVNPDNDGYTAKITNCTFDGEVFGEGSGAGIALIGGIAGSNAYGGEIEHCYIGVITDDNSSNDIQRVTKIYAGKQETTNASGQTVLTEDPKVEIRNKGTEYEVKLITTPYDTMSYAYIGGIAGDNYGKVASCDNYVKSKEPVRVYSFISSSGGIVGYSYQGSFVTGTKEEHLTTGKNWEVKARSTDNDRGNGGIIGFYKCTNDINYCDNYANVQCIYKANTSVSGIVGFINQSYDTKVNVFNCRNYGYILGNTRTGGLVSHLSFTGIRFENCINYGTVRALNDEAGGILQCIWQAAYDVEFINCFNHGNVLSPNSTGAGFYAKRFDEQPDGGKARYINCVNTGAIGRLAANDTKPNYSSAATQSMAGFSSYHNSYDAFYTNCRNYFGFKTSNAYGLGISGVNAKDCLDVSQNKNTTKKDQYIGTLANRYNDANKSTNNYYVLKESSEPYDDSDYGVASSNYGVYTSITSNYTFVWANNGNNILSLYDTADAGKVIRSFKTIDSGKTLKLDFDMAYYEGSTGVDGLIIYYANNGNDTNQTYNYSYTLYDADGKKLGNTISGIKTVPSNNSLEEGKVVLDFAEYRGTQVAKVSLETKNAVNGKYSAFHGFGCIPCDDSSMVCYFTSMNSYIGKMTKTGVDFTASTIVPIATFSESASYANGYQNVLLYDYISDLALENGVRFSYNLPNSNKVSSWLSFDFDFTYEDEAKGLGAMYVYFDTNNGLDNGTKRNYEYYAVFTDESGRSYSAGTQDNPYSIKAALNHQEAAINVPDTCTGKVKNVKLYLKCTNSSWINFGGFRWSEKENDERFLLPIYFESETVDLFQNSVANELIYEKESDGTIKLYPNIKGLKNSANYGITMKNDIKSETFYNDVTAYDPVYDTPKGKDTWAKDTRVAVFKELDPKYEEFLYTQTYDPYVKLAKPSNGSISNAKGIYKLSWNRVKNATGYFTRYELIDSTGTVKYSSDYSEAIISADTSCSTTYGAGQIDANYKAAGGTGDYAIKFYVKAISAYHRLNAGADDEGKYDSDEYDFSINALKALPTPEFHVEYITGNKAVVVIDNFDDYREIENYQDAVKIIINSPKTGIFENKNNIEINVSEGRAYSKPFTLTISSVKGDTGVNAHAEPTSAYTDKYMNSVYTYLAGALMNGNEHANGVNNNLYVESTEFLGFYGQSFDELTYNIRIGAVQVDLYTVGDLVAYDSELGVDVAYDRGNIHTAARNGGSASYSTMSLSGLPEDILERDFELRTYLYATQNYLQRFGHEVALGVKLESVDDVKDITDEEYFNAEGVKAADIGENPSIYDEDKGKLKPGYVIYDNHDGTYDIYYSASLDADEQLAGNTGHYQVHHMPYVYSDNNDISSQLGYNYYIGKDKNYNGKDEKDINIAKSKVVMSVPTTITEKDGSDANWSRTNGTNNGKYGKDVKFNYVWIPTYDGERFDLQLKTRSTNTEDKTINSKFNANTSCSFNGKIYYADTTKGPTYDEQYAYGKDLYITRRDQLVQPKPVIEENLVQGINSNGNNTYTFSWDKDKTGDNYKDAEYSVILIGTSLDGEEVILTTPQLTTERSITFTDTENNWRYVGYTIKVTRLGTIDSSAGDNKTNFLPSVASQKCTSKLSLAQLPQPSVDLHSTQDASGHTEFNQDRQLYDVTWGSITDTHEKKDLGGYLIMVNVVEPKDENIVAKTHYYYVTDANAISHDDSIGLDINALSDGGKCVVVDLKNDVNSSYDDGYTVTNQHRAFIDLSDFNGGDKLNIKVQAIARTNSVNYIDGLYSEAAELVLHERLDTPDITKLEANIDTSLPSITITELNYSGFKLTYTDSGKGSEQGYYDIAIAAYDEDGKESQDNSEISKEGGTAQVLHTGDGADTDSGYWNSGAANTLVKKSAKNRMDGTTLSSAEYVFKSNGNFKAADYAGKWLKVTIRARSDNKISSWWTDEDPDNASVNYIWIHVPKVKLDSPDLQEAITPESISYYNNPNDENRWSKTMSDDPLHNIEVKRKTFEFDPVEYADGYELKYIGYNNSIQYIYMIPNESNTEFEVYGYSYVSSDETIYLDDSENNASILGHQTEYYGKLSDDNIVELPFGNSFNTFAYIPKDLDDIYLKAELKIGDNNKILMILPDLVDKITTSEGINNEFNVEESEYNFTKQVTVQAIIDEDNEFYYISSPVNSWDRNSSSGKSGTINNDYTTDGAVTDINSEISPVSGFEAIDSTLNKVEGETKHYYNVGFESTSQLVIKIRVTDGTGTDITTSYIVTKPDSEGTSFTNNMAILSNYVDDASGYKMYISVAKINDNGISEWSDEWSFSKSGIGDKVQH